MPFTSTHRFARISARKARLVADLIRGKSVDQALTALTFSKKRAAVLVGKTLRSAIANADQAEADVRSLVVTEARVDEGPTMKRFQPKDRGRANPIMKRTSHISIAVDQGKPKKR
jgi:large subunit ribosomal protein L22